MTRSTLDAAGDCNRRADPVSLGHSMQGSIQSNEHNDQLRVQTEMRIEVGVEFTSVCTYQVRYIPGEKTQLPTPKINRRLYQRSTRLLPFSPNRSNRERTSLVSPCLCILLVISAICYITFEEPRVNHGGTSRKYRLILIV